MNNIDIRYLRKGLIMLAASLLIFIALVLVGYQYEAAKVTEYSQALSSLRSTHSKYNKLVKDIDLLDQYRALYSDYKASGLVGQERRLSWLESLESTNDVLKLPTLSYRLLPQEDFQRPQLKIQRDVDIKSSPMELSMGLLHEEDLLALIEALRQSVKNLFTIDSCSLSRSSKVDSSLDTKKANLMSNCVIRWVSIDAK